MRREVEAALTVRAAHRWSGATDHRRYLAHSHVHMFGFRIWVDVSDPDREVEFHDLQDALDQAVNDISGGMLPGNIIDFGERSCEHLAEDVLRQIPSARRVRVEEDNFVAAVVEREDDAPSSDDDWLSRWNFRHYMDRPQIVTLCGSTRFKDEFREAEARLEDAGICVMTVGFFAHADSVPLTVERKERADELHKWKISLSDYVFVVNPGGYIGESTRSEIDFAHDLGVPVRYLVDPNAD